MQSHVGDDMFNLKQQLSNVVTSKVGHAKVKVGNRAVTMKDDQAFVRPRHPKRVEFGPVTATTVQFGGSQQITEFRVYEQQDFEQCDMFVVRGTISSSSGKLGTPYIGAANPANAAATDEVLCEPSPLWIERIELLANGSTTVLQTIYGEQLWSSLASLPKEKLQTLLTNNLMYMGDDFKVNNSLHRDAFNNSVTWRHKTGVYTRPFIIPIVGGLLEKLRLRAICGDTIVRVYWNTSIAGVTVGIAHGALPTFTPTTAASGKFSLANLQLILESEEVLQRDKMAYESMLRSGSLLVKFVEPMVQSFTQVINPSTEYGFQLTGIYGDIAFLQIYIRALNTAKSVLRPIGPEDNGEAGVLSATLPFVDAQDGADSAFIQLTDASNKQLFTPNGFKVWDLRYGQYNRALLNTFCNSVPMYWLPFCENPAAAIHEGAIDGYAYFDATEYVRIRPSAAWNAGTSGTTFQVQIVAWKIKHAQVDKGQVKIL